MKRIISGALVAVALMSCSEDVDRRPVEIARTDSALVPLEDSAPAQQEVTRPEEEVTRPAPPPPRARTRAAPKPTPRPAETAPDREPAPADTLAPEPAAAPAEQPVSSSEDTVIPGTVAATPAESTPLPEPSAPDSAVAEPPVPPVRAPDTIGTARPVPPRSPRPTVPAPTSAPTPASPQPSVAATLPAGTQLHAALTDSIHSRHDSAGRSVTAKVMENVTGPDGRTLIPAGAVVQLTVVKLAPAKSRSADDGSLELRVDGIARGSELLPVRADVHPVAHELRGRGVTGSEAAKVGAGAAAGAIAGRVIGGDTRGAVIGGVVGAAGGAAVAAQTADRDVVVKAGTPITFVLTAPLAAGQL